MSSVERAVYDHLRADVSVAALVGTRVYTGIAPEDDELPNLTLTVAGENPIATLAGASAGLTITRVDVSAWGDIPDDGIALAEVVRLSMQGYSGLMGTQQLVVRHVSLDDRRNDEFEPDTADDVWTFRTLLDFVITHVQPIPTF